MLKLPSVCGGAGREHRGVEGADGGSSRGVGWRSDSSSRRTGGSGDSDLTEGSSVTSKSVALRVAASFA